MGASRRRTRIEPLDHQADDVRPTRHACRGAVQPGELLLGTPGYTFGLGFAVRQGDGIAGVPGSAGEFVWAGYAGTFFWVDPQEELVGVYMTPAPSPIRAYYRKMFKALVYQALVD